MCSRHASWSGNTAAKRFSDSIRCNGAAIFAPPRKRGTAKERVAFQRHRIVNIGASNKACTSKSRTVLEFRYRNTSSSGNECCVPSEITIASSVAAACSSKLNERQKRFRNAKPQARLIRLPKGACKTSCIPPDSSKKRSSTSVCCEGIAPNEQYASAKYAATCSAAFCGNWNSLATHSSISEAEFSASRTDKRFSTSIRRSETACESSLVRAGASPSQNG